MDMNGRRGFREKWGGEGFAHDVINSSAIKKLQVIHIILLIVCKMY
jgi:hypothetical protein